MKCKPAIHFIPIKAYVSMEAAIGPGVPSLQMAQHQETSLKGTVK